MNDRPEPDRRPPARDEAESGGRAPSAAAHDSAEAAVNADGPEKPANVEGAQDPGPTAGLPKAGADGGGPQAGAGRARDAAAAGGDEYAEQNRADVTHVYVDNRTIGVSIEGTVTARDIAGHDKTLSSEEGPRDARQRTRTVSVVAIARRDCDKLSRVAVSVGQHDRACAVLERERVVILHGPAGVGKGTAGLSLLGFKHEVLSVDPSVTTKDLAEFRARFPYGPDRRYLVEALSPVTARQLTSFVTRTLTRDLDLEKSYLIMTVDDHIPLSPELASCVVSWADRPDTALTLRKHLAYYLADGNVTAVEERFDLTQVCTGLADRAVRAVDEVACSVAEAFTASRSIESLLDDLGFGAQARVDEWFSTERSPDELSLLLSIAVLGGSPYNAVARHARRLEELIAKRSRISLTTRPIDPLRSRSERLHAAMAVLEAGFVETEYGQSPAEIVRLESRWLVHAVLDSTWREYDVVADALLDWLYEAGDDPDPGVRLRAAAAAGWLSQYDFATLRRRLLVPWARGSSEAARAAADALGQAAWLDSTAPLALALLSTWAWQDEDYDLWWTAAVAYGGEAGVRLPSVAMDQLMAIAVRGDDLAPPVVAQCVVRLVTSGGRFASDIASYVLSHLIRWLKDSPAAARTAEMIYAELLSRAGDPDWPAAAQYSRLLLAPENLKDSATLLRAALGERAFRNDALASLRLLVRAGDQDPEARDKLAALLRRVASSPGSTATDKDRLVYYLDRWASGKDPSPAARAIGALLQEAAMS